jgi:hypothetical protein
MKLFSDLFDALEKAFKAIRAIANLPKETRDELRITFNETFTLLDTSLNMVIIRLGEILRITDEPVFMIEVSQLNNDAGWTTAERQFRLCKSLRHTVNETVRLRNRILNYISVKDWDEMQYQMELILWSEDKLGNYVAERFQALSGMVAQQGGTTQQVRDSLKLFQDSLNTERRRLIAMEIDLYKNF